MSQNRETTSSKTQGGWSRIEFDWPTIGIIAVIIFGIAGLLWNSIENVDDDVDRLYQRVNQIDDKFDVRMERLTKDIGYIKGRIGAQLSAKDEEPVMPENKKPRGRPVEKTMPPPIPDTPENVARAIMQSPPKKTWSYLKREKK